MNEQSMQKLAELAVRSGVSIQIGDDVIIRAPVIALPLIRKVAEEAYKAGAARVHVSYKDDEISRLHYKYESKETLGKPFPFILDELNYFDKPNSAIISILSEDPDAYANTNIDKITAYRRAINKGAEPFYSAMMLSKTRWTVIAYPNQAWAKKAFPDLSDEAALDKLEEYIVHASRCDTPNPVHEWAEHSKRLHARSEILNKLDVDYFEYKNSLGTNIKLGMPKGYVFMGGSERAESGIDFNANIPSEEVFSAPDRNRADGVVHASMPLVYNGKVIKDFWIKFKDGAVESYDAKENKDVLKSIIETDENSNRLGEIALVPYSSPISDLNTLFFETLFDENASCHLALGQAYATCLEGGGNMTKEELMAHGVNDSHTHVDFMIGTSDLSITAATRDGKEVQIFKDGNFVI